MRRFNIQAVCFLATMAIGLLPCSLQAQVTFECEIYPVPQAAIDAGAPEGRIFDYFVTTDADILSIGQVEVVLGGTGELFQVAPPFGSNTTPPPQAFIDLNPALLADSWVTTPGATSLLGTDLPGDSSTTTFGDLSNDGPQTDFHYMRLTFPTGTFGFASGVVTIAGSTGPESYPIPICFPEPSSLLLVCLGLGFVGSRRFR